MAATNHDGAFLLSAYLKKHDLPAAAIARRAGISATTITRALRRVRAMDIYSAAKLETATGGEVPAVSWALVKLPRPSGAGRTKSAA